MQFIIITFLSGVSLLLGAHTLVQQRTSATKIMVNTLIFLGLLATMFDMITNPITPFVQINGIGLVLSFIQIISMYSLRHYAADEDESEAVLNNTPPPVPAHAPQKVTIPEVLLREQTPETLEPLSVSVKKVRTEETQPV